MGAKRIINIIRGKISKSEENHNIEELHSVPRETKDSHTDITSFQNDQEEKVIFKKHPGR